MVASTRGKPSATISSTSASPTQDTKSQAGPIESRSPGPHIYVRAKPRTRLDEYLDTRSRPTVRSRHSCTNTKKPGRSMGSLAGRYDTASQRSGTDSLCHSMGDYTHPHCHRLKATRRRTMPRMPATHTSGFAPADAGQRWRTRFARCDGAVVSTSRSLGFIRACCLPEGFASRVDLVSSALSDSRRRRRSRGSLRCSMSPPL